MTKRMRVQFERVNLVAVFAIGAATLLALLGKVPAELVLGLITGVAIPAHSEPPPA